MNEMNKWNEWMKWMKKTIVTPVAEHLKFLIFLLDSLSVPLHPKLFLEILVLTSLLTNSWSLAKTPFMVDSGIEKNLSLSEPEQSMDARWMSN